MTRLRAGRGRLSVGSAGLGSAVGWCGQGSVDGAGAQGTLLRQGGSAACSPCHPCTPEGPQAFVRILNGLRGQVQGHDGPLVRGRPQGHAPRTGWTYSCPLRGNPSRDRVWSPDGTAPPDSQAARRPGGSCVYSTETGLRHGPPPPRQLHAV